jgi:hypothetical protein
MAVSLKVKTKAAPKSATAMTVDRIIELKKQIDALAPITKEYDKLTKGLREQAMEQDPSQPVVFEGTDYSVVFSEATKVRKIDNMMGLKKALGNEVFWEVAKITLTDVDKYLTPNESAEFITIENGARKIDIIEK